MWFTQPCGYKICDSCRKEIQLSAKEQLPKKRELESSSDDESEQIDPLCTPEKDEAFNALNKSLIALNESPLQKKRLDPEQDDIPMSPDREIINQLKEKYKSTDDKSIRMQILTTMPKSWTLKDYQDEFDVTDYTARKAKNLVKEKGVMSCPDPKPGKTLDYETAKKVTDLYESEEISRMMPGKKDFISLKISNKKVRHSNEGSETEASKVKDNVSNEDSETDVILSNHYEYTNLTNLHESEEKESFNIYGIVDKCDLKVTHGKKSQILDLCLTDETEVGFTCSVFAAKDENFPDVYPGDIIRVHRMQVYKFRGKLKGKCLSSKFILVFSKSNNGTKPKTVAKSFTFTPHDEERVKELFEWNQKQSDPKLISEINKDDFVNIICQVIGVYIAKTTDAVILKIWDGTKTNLFPGSHFGFREEKLDQRLFNIARNYYVILSVYGNYIGIAAELQPGQYIEVLDAHLYSPKDNPDECKLCLHAGNKGRRGISVLDDEDEKLVNLKERLGKIISDSEFSKQTDDLLSENNSIFLNCASQNENANDPSTSNQNEENLNEDIELLNKPLVSKHEKMESSQSIENSRFSLCEIGNSGYDPPNKPLE
ncbi:uncharacterized protein LOC129220668 [Uloborus diversus]|uniref:uncharacterized protein LOC129220668 n=1 Tax=Uloborus diversus TaxID=327109 RepID=UPI00240A4734|nr:uncharacterized protein LOC129220668 [Uloborus diversus]